MQYVFSLHGLIVVYHNYQSHSKIVVVWYRLHLPISLRITSLVPRQSCDCPESVKQPWSLRVNFDMNTQKNCDMNTTMQNTTKPWAYLIHCCLATPYNDIALGQHWQCWFIKIKFRWHWSESIPEPSIMKNILKIIDQKFPWSQWVNGSMTCCRCGIYWHIFS